MTGVAGEPFDPTARVTPTASPRGAIVSPAAEVSRAPVIYVRGYAGPARGIDKAADDAFYGFNDGSSHARIDGDGEPMFYQFESPLLRLMIDEDYEVLVRGSQHAYLEQSPDGSIGAAAIWVHRFYDEAAGTFGRERESFDIVRAAEGLYDFVSLVRQKTTGAPRVHLVAHSMGGLVCRTMLQRVCREPDRHGRARTAGRELVDRVVTMGTPHRGIETRFAFADLLNEVVGVFGSEIFSPRNMYGYLTPASEAQRRPPQGWQAHEVDPVAFPPDRFFCVVGTNPADYGQARHAIGAKSDGLVRVDNAYVRGAPRSFVHRAHSGRFGLVNSEEGYQSLRRFLFGSARVDVQLVGIDLLGERRPDVERMSDVELVATYQELVGDGREFARPEERVFWQADVQVTIRGLPVVLHEQSVEKNCPVQLTQEQARRHLEWELGRRGLLGLVEAPDSADTPVPLTTVFLLDPDRFEADRPAEPRPPRCRYTMRLRVFRLEQRGRFLGLGRHIEQVADWEDALIVDIGRGDGDDGPQSAWAAWNSEVVGPNADRDPIFPTPLSIEDGVAEIPLPANARQGVFGTAARLRLRIAPWP
jgi:pimeloyl-ACP methyl ester carboxylesterase